MQNIQNITVLVIIFSSLFILNTKAQTFSDIIYDAGTILEVQTGADVCATNIYINGTWSGGGSICASALPVSISLFNYNIDKRTVSLFWVTEWELNNSGFDIERACISSDLPVSWQKIAHLKGKGTTNAANGYIYRDEHLTTGKYKYRLKQIDYNGNYEYYNLNIDVDLLPPKNFALSQNYPNPGNPNTTINFEIPVNGKVSIVVYDLLGKEIKTLIKEYLEADYYKIDFNSSGISSGVYFYRIIAEGEDQIFTKTLKLTIVK